VNLSFGGYLRTMRKVLLLLIGLVLFVDVRAQDWDTLRVMTYNLLYYGEVTSFCTAQNNDINDKDTYFEVIAKHVKPDLLLVNEMGASIVYADRIINNVLNTDGVNRYKRAPIQNNSFSDLVNGVFYDKNKLVLHAQDKLTQATNGSSIVRAIDICTFYYKDPLLKEGSDTVFLYLVGMHLKAGGTSSDVSARDIATQSLMEYLVDNYPLGYFIAAGDMNVGGSSEAGFQNFLSNTYGDHRFYDPLIPGGWSSTSSFAYAHTQSTHTSGDCFSGGGMDDRFDLILMSGQIMEDTGMVSFVEDSYVTVGNDGNHFNQALTDGTNSSVPSAVLGALYEMSDHLPVRADIRVKRLEEDTIPTGVNYPSSRDWKLVSKNNAVQIRGFQRGDQVQVHDLTGRLHESRVDASGKISTIGWPAGLYFITLNDGKMRRSFKWFVL